ncbi:hypothetical protein DCC39_11825 [Pueribacillus theae]|uniref:Uncharacterized protein n=1 Tax=Pueribacillus theae TaxID=2171751 RepID=A0A2U1JYL2_9BACI|nr:hypothetical protein [Pueribacillus theae]PWA10075.1 hypothetical protein DCC39_11825 [Pueribacillus theae]
MNAWGGLLKKEFRLGLPGLYLALVLLAIWFGFGGFLQWKWNEPGILFGFSVAAIVFHIFYLPVYMLMSANGEKGRMHLWLHSPHSGTALLLAKLLNGIFAMLVSLCISLGIFFFAFNLNNAIVQDALAQLNHKLVLVIQVLVHLIGASIYLTIWGIFLWVLSIVLKRVTGKFNWVAMLFIIIIGLSLINSWESSSLFDMLTHWGSFSISISGFEMIVQDEMVDFQSEGIGKIFLGKYVYYAIVALIVFFASGWMLDRKVEV